MQHPISDTHPITFDSFQLIAEVYRFRDEVRDLVAENNLLKIRLSEMLEGETGQQQIEEAETCQSRFMAYEERLMRLCARSRRQLVILLRNDISYPDGKEQILNRQADLWQKLREVRGEIQDTRKYLLARFGC